MEQRLVYYDQADSIMYNISLTETLRLLIYSDFTQVGMFCKEGHSYDGRMSPSGMKSSRFTDPSDGIGDVLMFDKYALNSMDVSCYRGSMKEGKVCSGHPVLYLHNRLPQSLWRM